MASHEHAQPDAFVALAQISVEDGTLGETLRHIAGILQCSVPAEMAGVTLVAAGKPRSAGCTHACVAEIDGGQYEAGCGPCMGAVATCQPRRVELPDGGDPDDGDDLPDGEHRRPPCMRRAADLGVRCSLSVLLTARGEASARAPCTRATLAPSTMARWAGRPRWPGTPAWWSRTCSPIRRCATSTRT